MTFFFFNDTATTEIYTLSLHDALPISGVRERGVDAGLVHQQERPARLADAALQVGQAGRPDRKSTRLNSSHGYISYAVFCLKKKQSTLLPACCLILMTTRYRTPR